MKSKSGKKSSGAKQELAAYRSSPTGSGLSFRNPPVDEVVCGIRFEPIANFKIPHFGLLWQKLGESFPKIEHVAPIASGGNLVIDTASGAPLPRIWFVNESDDELVQFQVDQLYFNWRRRERDYPRFASIFPKFEFSKTVLDSLLKELKLPPVVIVEHELTYINHIPQGQGWSALEDLPKIFPHLSSNKSAFSYLPQPKNLAWTMRFELPKDQGHLDIRLSQGTKRIDKQPTLLLHLSARGRALSAAWSASQSWFALAHDWIVNGFADITAPDIQKSVWRREDV